MAPDLTPEELQAKLRSLSAGTMPAVARGMQKAVLNVEAEAKKNCTPGQSPYAKAPYSDDRDPHRKPPHLRDTIKGELQATGSSVVGTVGTPKSYALSVHEGTSKMEARPFIMDAIVAKKNETLSILSEGVSDAIRRQCI